MKFLLLFLAGSLCLQSFAQIDSLETERADTVQVDLISNLLPEMIESFHIGFLGSASMSVFGFNQNASQFNPEMSSGTRYSGGVVARYYIKENWFVDASMMGTNIRLFADYGFNSAQDGDPLIPVRSTASLSYIRIPLMVGYSKQVWKVLFTPALGVTTDLKVNHYERTEYQDGDKRTSQILPTELNTPHLHITAQLGASIPLNSSMSLNVLPFASQGLNKIDEILVSKPELNYGLACGLLWRLN